MPHSVLKFIHHRVHRIKSLFTNKSWAFIYYLLGAMNFISIDLVFLFQTGRNESCPMLVPRVNGAAHLFTSKFWFFVEFSAAGTHCTYVNLSKRRDDWLERSFRRRRRFLFKIVVCVLANPGKDQVGSSKGL